MDTKGWGRKKMTDAKKARGTFQPTLLEVLDVLARQRDADSVDCHLLLDILLHWGSLGRRYGQ